MEAPCLIVCSLHPGACLTCRIPDVQVVIPAGLSCEDGVRGSSEQNRGLVITGEDALGNQLAGEPVELEASAG